MKWFILLISFLVSAPAVAQTNCKNATAYGADPTGGSPSDAAFNSAIAASDGTHICVYFPAGLYYFQGSLSVSPSAGNSTASVTILGDGAETTQLRFSPGVSGISLSLNNALQNFHIRRLTLLAGDKSNTTKAISVSNNSSMNPSQSDLTEVTIRGSDGFNQSFRWGYGIDLYKVSNVNIISVQVSGSSDGAAYATAGTCVRAYGTASVIPVQINIIGSQLNYCQYGFFYGQSLQGVQISTSNFVGNYAGIYLPGQQSGNDQLAVNASQFNSGAFDIAISSPIDGVSIAGNDFYAGSAGAIGIVINNTDQFIINGNSFISLAQNQDGVHIGPYGGAAGIITGNIFKNGFVTSVWLTSGSQHVNVQSNAYVGTTNSVINQGANNTVGGGSA